VAIENGEPILTTGGVLQELSQGFSGPKARDQIPDRFSALPILVPDRANHIEAAALRNYVPPSGVRIGTIDALLAQLSICHGLLSLRAIRIFSVSQTIAPYGSGVFEGVSGSPQRLFNSD
jgi:hypothetical protein